MWYYREKLFVFSLFHGLRFDLMTLRACRLISDLVVVIVSATIGGIIFSFLGQPVSDCTISCASTMAILSFSFFWFVLICRSGPYCWLSWRMCRLSLATFLQDLLLVQEVWISSVKWCRCSIRVQLVNLFLHVFFLQFKKHWAPNWNNL